jgi:DNA invertase Pin-like site-specific DNA recombinase
MWTKDGNAVKKGSGEPATFTRKNAAPSKDDVIELLKKHNGDIKAIAYDKKITYQAVWNWLKAYDLKAAGFSNSTH